MMTIMKPMLMVASSALPLSVNALDALDDDFLSGVTGKEGLTIEQSYYTTIEEVLYVDGDGDNGDKGVIKITDYETGEFSSSTDYDDYGSLTPNGALTQVYSKIAIDAASDGVLITTEELGQSGVMEYDVSGNALGTGFGDGIDTRLGGLQLGNENNTENTIGTLTTLNATNYLGSYTLARMRQNFGVGTSTTTTNHAGGGFIEAETLISSKTSGTGIHIVQEGSNPVMQASYYEDTDTASNNKIGVYGYLQFREAETNDIDSVAAHGTGNYIRGTRTEFELDVDNGALVLANMVTDSSTIIESIFIGEIGDSIGSIAILGMHSESTIKISAH